MSYSICYLRNITDEPLTIKGKIIQPDEIYQILDTERVDFAMDDAVICAIVQGCITILDANGEISGIAEKIAHLQKY